jgi:hypothetical protein
MQQNSCRESGCKSAVQTVPENRLRIDHLMAWDYAHADFKEDNAEKILGNES